MEQIKYLALTNSDNEIKSVAAFLRTIFVKRQHLFTDEYITWLYQKNPVGKAVGFNAYYNNQLVGHYVTIPTLVKIDGTATRGLLSLNTASHPDYRGRGLFTGLADQTYELGAQNNYRFVIGVANQNSTHGFTKKLGFQLVSPLEVRLGLGHAPICKRSEPARFDCQLGDESLEWRFKKPGTHYFQADQSVYRFINSGVFKTKMCTLRQPVQLRRKPIFSTPLTLYMGLDQSIDWKENKNFFVLPDRLKPSPLNLIYKSLDGQLPTINKNDVLFESINFDAY